MIASAGDRFSPLKSEIMLNLFSNRDQNVRNDVLSGITVDQSGLEAINGLAEKYEHVGKRLHLTHLSLECRALLNRAGDLVEVNLSEDPQYHVATDRIRSSMLEHAAAIQKNVAADSASSRQAVAGSSSTV